MMMAETQAFDKQAFDKLGKLTQLLVSMDSIFSFFSELVNNTTEKDKIGKEILPYTETFLLISSKKLGYSVILVLQAFKPLKKVYRVNEYVSSEEFTDFMSIGNGNILMTQPILNTIFAYFGIPLNAPYQILDIEIYQFIRKNKEVDSEQLKQHVTHSKDSIKSVTLVNNVVQIFYEDNSFVRFTITNGNVDSVKELLDNLFKPVYNSTKPNCRTFFWVNQEGT